MELFLNQDSTDLMSLAIELFSVYVKVPQRDIVTLNYLSASAI